MLNYLVLAEVLIYFTYVKLQGASFIKLSLDLNLTSICR